MSSSVSDAPAGHLASREWVWLAGLGLLAALIHRGINLPLALPGHHGLEWMALLMFGRILAETPRAATMIAASAATCSALPLFAYPDHAAGLGYLVSGFVVDAGWRWLGAPRFGLAVVLAALAHAAKPLLKYAAMAGVGLHFGSVASGLAWPMLCHLAFGAVGGAAGVLAGLALRGPRAR